MIRAGLSIALLCACASSHAQNASSFDKGSGRYPNRPVRIIVNVSPGGGVDAVARIVAQHYNAVWGQPFIVDNRTGAGGSIGVELVAKAAPDGYTLLVASSGIVTNAAVRPQGYDPIRDLQPITMLTTAPYLLVTTASLPVASVKDLVALAKSKPGRLSFGSSGNGSILHLGAELLVALSGTQMLHVPYKGVADAYPAVVAGDVNWVLGFPTSALPLVKAGRLKAIAVTSAKRSKLLPELPHRGRERSPRLRRASVVRTVRAGASARGSPCETERRSGACNAGAGDRQAHDTGRRGNRGQFAAGLLGGGSRAEYAKWRDLVKKTGIKL